MKKIYTLLFSALFIGLQAQDIKSPSEFLGYELGTQFTRHHEVLSYYNYVAASLPAQVNFESYGKTYERRPLTLATLSSAANMSRLEEIRNAHLQSLEGKGTAEIAVVWLSYNVHGNESVSTEASMQTLYDLLTSKKDYLENTVVIIDPCINPDGRDRYVNWYNQYKNSPFQVDPYSTEHHEGWWSGRSNHYMFDLNRDWAWLTQKESQQRLKKYMSWYPHIHVDFHEQGVDDPYFFAPAAEPYHEVITSFQREFQETIGRNHAKYFDAQGWFYFTKEVFDLFYPSYGDTYPTYNGAIGMTYEQGGSGRAGLGIKTSLGDTLTLKDRIAHHLTTGLSTVEVASKNSERLNEEFRKFYGQNKNFKYKSYVLSGNEDHLKSLKKLLNQHQIVMGRAPERAIRGFNYSTGNTASMTPEKSGIVVSTNQNKGTLVKVLFEPNAKLSDSVTYDITAWSLPYAYGLEAVASESLVAAAPIKVEKMNAPMDPMASLDRNAYAYLTDWNSMYDARYLAALLKAGIRVRTADKDFRLEGRRWKRGSLIITKADNSHLKEFSEVLIALHREFPDKELISAPTGFVDDGKDFGSDYVRMIPKQKIAVLAGEPTSTLRFGEIWHFFEQQLEYPVSVLNTDYFNRVDLSQYDVLILPDGYGYRSFLNEQRLAGLKEWVASGGTLISMGGASAYLGGENGFSIKRKQAPQDSAQSEVAPFENGRREGISRAITGAIFKAKVDNTNPLAYGYGNDYFTLKLGSTSYDYLDRGTAVYLEDRVSPVAGFAGSEAVKNLPNSMIFGMEGYGRGQVVYLADNPLFRGFWENGKLFFVNALFMVD